MLGVACAHVGGGVTKPRPLVTGADRAATFNGVGYTDHVAAALALYFRLLALDATEATAGKASKAAVGLLLQLTGSDPAVICDTLLQIDAGSFDGPAAAFCWRLMRGTVSGFERTIGWASQERAFDTFLRLALLARSAKQVGEEAGADAADLSTCAKFPAKVRCSFSTERLRSRIEQLAPVNRYPSPPFPPFLRNATLLHGRSVPAPTAGPRLSFPWCGQDSVYPSDGSSLICLAPDSSVLPRMLYVPSHS